MRCLRQSAYVLGILGLDTQGTQVKAAELLTPSPLPHTKKHRTKQSTRTVLSGPHLSLLLPQGPKVSHDMPPSKPLTATPTVWESHYDFRYGSWLGLFAQTVSHISKRQTLERGLPRALYSTAAYVAMTAASSDPEDQAVPGLMRPNLAPWRAMEESFKLHEMNSLSELPGGHTSHKWTLHCNSEIVTAHGRFDSVAANTCQGKQHHSTANLEGSLRSFQDQNKPIRWVSRLESTLVGPLRL